MSPGVEEQRPPAGGAQAPSPFSRLVRTARLRSHLSQQELASRLHRTKQWVNAIEKSDLPPVEQVVWLHDELLRLSEPQRTPSLGFWLLTWLAQHSERNASDRAGERISQALRAATPLFPDVLAWPARQRSPLADFPSAFDRIIVIGGDRRESPAHSGGDLFARSASVLDLHFLNRLRLGLRDVTVWYDKVFVQMSEDYLRQHFGHSHLLVVGSPTVNLAARRINPQSLFRFNTSAESRVWEAELRRTFPRPLPFADERLLAFERTKDIFRLQDRPDVEVLDGVLRAIEAEEAFDPEKHLDDHQRAWYEDRRQGVATVARQMLRGRKPSDWAGSLRSLEIADPAGARLHALDEDPAKRLHEDLAVVSVGANPFADDDAYVSILVAGIHGPGTAHAIKALADDDFTDRPLGGVLKVHLAPDRELPERVTHAHREWLTPPYDIDTVRHNLDERSAAFAGEWAKELDDWRALPARLLAAGPRP